VGEATTTNLYERACMIKLVITYVCPNSQSVSTETYMFGDEYSLQKFIQQKGVNTLINLWYLESSHNQSQLTGT
jgi:hypothetical protein